MEKLSKESSTRESLEEAQVVLLYQMHDMEAMVEKERKQVVDAFLLGYDQRMCLQDAEGLILTCKIAAAHH